MGQLYKLNEPSAIVRQRLLVPVLRKMLRHVWNDEGPFDFGECQGVKFGDQCLVVHKCDGQ